MKIFNISYTFWIQAEEIDGEIEFVTKEKYKVWSLFGIWVYRKELT